MPFDGPGTALWALTVRLEVLVGCPVRGSPARTRPDPPTGAPPNQHRNMDTRPAPLALPRHLDVVILPGQHDATQEFAQWVISTLQLDPRQVVYTPGPSSPTDDGLGEWGRVHPGALAVFCLSLSLLALDGQATAGGRAGRQFSWALPWHAMPAPGGGGGFRKHIAARRWSWALSGQAMPGHQQQLAEVGVPRLACAQARRC
jgi:hypothetical protein